MFPSLLRELQEKRKKMTKYIGIPLACRKIKIYFLIYNVGPLQIRKFLLKLHQITRNSLRLVKLYRKVFDKVDFKPPKHIRRDEEYLMVFLDRNFFLRKGF